MLCLSFFLGSRRPSLFIGAKGTESSMHIDSGGTNFWLYLLSGVCLDRELLPIIDQKVNVLMNCTILKRRAKRMGVLRLRGYHQLVSSWGSFQC